MKEGWRRAILAEKFPDKTLKQNPDILRGILKEDTGGLRMERRLYSHYEWLGVEARGEDSEAFLNLLREKFGEVPVQSSRVERWDVRKGFVTGAGRVGFGVYVDLGVFEPSRKDALYPLHRMRAQLADGEAKACREVLDENAIQDYVPLKVIVSDIDGEKMSVELADGTREVLLSWRQFPFDRVLAIGASRELVERAVRSAGLQNDVVRIESLSLLVQCVLCKIGTDAPGVIARIGGRLGGTRLAAYKTPVRIT